MSTKKAAKLDMDDRAKIVQYFTRPVNGAGDISGMYFDFTEFFFLIPETELSIWRIFYLNF